MSQTNNSLWKSTMTSGAILGITFVIYSVIVYFLGLTNARGISWLSYAILLGGIIYGIKLYRDKELQGAITYGQALGAGVLVSLFGAVIISFYTYLQMKFIDPTLIDKALEISRQSMIDKGMSDDQIETGLSVARKVMTPGIMAFWVVVGYVFFGFIFSLVVAAFMKKEPNIFEQQQTNDSSTI